MEKFIRREGLVAPLDRANVDTDAIIPKQYLKSIKRTGYGPNLFDEWRYLDHGEPGMDHSKRPLNSDFVLNQPRYRGAITVWKPYCSSAHGACSREEPQPKFSRASRMEAPW